MTLGIGEGGFVRPTELLTFLSESLTWEIPALPIHRLELFRKDADSSFTSLMDI